jgi:lipopolysaccharide biosynthesis glycosyltransferase
MLSETNKLRVCFGVVSIGEDYTKEFNELFKPSLNAYTSKYGYDLKVFTEMLDPTQTHHDTISFQKCLVPAALPEYDWVVVLDADIYIEKSAPTMSNMFHLLGDRVGMVDEVCKYNPPGTEYYKMADFDLETNVVVNSGMMICSPSKHGAFLKDIYEKYIPRCVGHPRKFHYEQSCIGYELLKNDKVCLVPRAWNYIYVYQLPEKKYFVHFAGYQPYGRRANLAVHLAKSRIRWGIH